MKRLLEIRKGVAETMWNMYMCMIIRGEALVERIRLAEDLTFSRIIHGLWRLAEWNYSKEQILDLIEILQSSMGHEVP
jgi:hypothetical protein